MFPYLSHSCSTYRMHIYQRIICPFPPSDATLYQKKHPKLLGKNVEEKPGYLVYSMSFSQPKIPNPGFQLNSEGIRYLKLGFR